jgi:hypothetical protein
VSRIVAALIAVGLALSLLVLGVGAQDAEDQAFDFSLSEAFVRTLAQQNTILFKMPLLMQSHSKVHSLAQDCEIHIAAKASGDLAWPTGFVVEPPNVCKERAAGMPSTGSPTSLWPKYLDQHVMGQQCEVVGFPRIFTEHAAGNADPSNPNHVLEIHPALSLTCGSFQLDMRSFLKAYPGMRQIKPETAASCIAGRQLQVRKHDATYEFRQSGGGSCGNFAVMQATVNPKWVRKISGGHSAIARVSPGGGGSYSLKLYTYGGTREDNLLANIAQGREPSRRLYFHGMFTYDYFSILRAVRDPDGTWRTVSEWTDVRFPLAFVVFGEAQVEETE